MLQHVHRRIKHIKIIVDLATFSEFKREICEDAV